MDEHSDRLTLMGDRGCHGAVAPIGHGEGRAGATDVTAIRRESAEPERRIAKRTLKRFLEVGRLPRIAELEQQLADGRTREAALNKRREKGDRQRKRRDHREPEAQETCSGRERSESEPDREEEQRDRPANCHG